MQGWLDTKVTRILSLLVKLVMSYQNTTVKQELIIEAGRTEQQYWKDLWPYRELFYFLAWRDILVL